MTQRACRDILVLDKIVYRCIEKNYIKEDDTYSILFGVLLYRLVWVGLDIVKRYRYRYHTVSFLNPLMLKDVLQILSSGSIILLTITLELRMVSQTIWRRVFGDVLTDISPSNIFLTMPFPAGFYQNYQAVFASVSINGLKELLTILTTVYKKLSKIINMTKLTR